MPRHPDVVFYSRFMLALDHKLSVERSPDTVNIIMRTLRRLCGEKFLSLEALKAFPTISTDKASYAAARLKDCYVALRVLEDPLWEEYKRRYEAAKKALEEEAASYEATEQQTKNWTSMTHLHELLDSWEPRIASLGFKEALGVAILALYTLLPPRRAMDFWKLMITSDPMQPTEALNVFNTVTNRIYLNSYKTAKVYGTYEVDVPPRLAKILTDVIALHPMRELPTFPLVCQKDGRIYSSCSCVSMLLKAVGANTTPTAIRHAAISEAFPTLPEEHAKRQELAKAMAHSTETQRKYIIRRTLQNQQKS